MLSPLVQHRGEFVTLQNVCPVQVSPIDDRGRASSDPLKCVRMRVCDLGTVIAEQPKGSTCPTLTASSAPVPPMFAIACIPVDEGCEGVIHAHGRPMRGVEVVPGSHYLVCSSLEDTPLTACNVDGVRHIVTVRGRSPPASKAASQKRKRNASQAKAGHRQSPDKFRRHIQRYACSADIGFIPAFTSATDGMQTGLASGCMDGLAASQHLNNLQEFSTPPLRPDACRPGRSIGISSQYARCMESLGAKSTADTAYKPRTSGMGNVAFEKQNVKELAMQAKTMAVVSPDAVARTGDIIFVTGSTAVRLKQAGMLIVVFGVFPAVQYGPLLPIPVGNKAVHESTSIELVHGAQHHTNQVPRSMRIHNNNVDPISSTLMMPTRTSIRLIQRQSQQSGLDVAKAFRCLNLSSPEIDVGQKVDDGSDQEPSEESKRRCAAVRKADMLPRKELGNVLRLPNPRRGFVVMNQGPKNVVNDRMGAMEVQFRRDGYTVLPNAIDSETVMRMRRYMKFRIHGGSMAPDMPQGRVHDVVFGALRNVIQGKDVKRVAGHLCTLFSPQPASQGKHPVGDPFTFPFHILGTPPSSGGSGDAVPEVFILPIGHSNPPMHSVSAEYIKHAPSMTAAERAAEAHVSSASHIFTKTLESAQRVRRGVQLLLSRHEGTGRSRYARLLRSRDLQHSPSLLEHNRTDPQPVRMSAKPRTPTAPPPSPSPVPSPSPTPNTEVSHGAARLPNSDALTQTDSESTEPPEVGRQTSAKRPVFAPEPSSPTTPPPASLSPALQSTQPPPASLTVKACVRDVHALIDKLNATITPASAVESPWMQAFAETFVAALHSPSSAPRTAQLMYNMLLRAAEVMMEGGDTFNRRQQMLMVLLWSFIGVKHHEWIAMRSRVADDPESMEKEFNRIVLRIQNEDTESSSVAGHMLNFVPAFFFMIRRSTAIVDAAFVFATMFAPLGMPSIQRIVQKAISCGVSASDVQDTSDGAYAREWAALMPKHAIGDQDKLSAPRHKTMNTRTKPASQRRRRGKGPSGTPREIGSGVEEDVVMSPATPSADGVVHGTGRPTSTNHEDGEGEAHKHAQPRATSHITTPPRRPPKTKTKQRVPKAPRKPSARGLAQRKERRQPIKPRKGSMKRRKGCSSVLLRVMDYVYNGISLAHPDWAARQGFIPKKRLTPQEFGKFLKHATEHDPMTIDFTSATRLLTYILNQMPCIRRDADVDSRANSNSQMQAKNAWKKGHTYRVEMSGRSIMRTTGTSATQSKRTVWVVLHPMFFETLFEAYVNRSGKSIVAEGEINEETEKKRDEWHAKRLQFSSLPESFVQANSVKACQQTMLRVADPTAPGKEIIWLSDIVDVVPYDKDYQYFCRDQTLQRSRAAASGPNGNTRAPESDRFSAFNTSWTQWKALSKYEGTIHDFVKQQCAFRGPDDRLYIAIVNKKIYNRTVAPHLTSYVPNIQDANQVLIRVSDGSTVMHCTYPLRSCVIPRVGTATNPVIPMQDLRVAHMHAVTTALTMFPRQQHRASAENIRRLLRHVKTFRLKSLLDMKEMTERSEEKEGLSSDKVLSFVFDRIQSMGGTECLGESIYARSTATASRLFRLGASTDDGMTSGSPPGSFSHDTHAFARKRISPAQGTTSDFSGHVKMKRTVKQMGGNIDPAALVWYGE